MKVALYEMNLSGTKVVLECPDSDDYPFMTRVSAIEEVEFTMLDDLAKTAKKRKLEAAQRIFDQAKAQLEALQNDES